MTEKLELNDLRINESTKISIYGTTIIIDQIRQLYGGVIGQILSLTMKWNALIYILILTL